MAVMTEGNAEQARDTRWSANKKTDAVLRLLRVEKLHALSELGVEAHRLAAWRDEFLAAGKQGLAVSRTAIGRPLPSTARCALVVNPPGERPIP